MIHRITNTYRCDGCSCDVDAAETLEVSGISYCQQCGEIALKVKADLEADEMAELTERYIANGFLGGRDHSRYKQLVLQTLATTTV